MKALTVRQPYAASIAWGVKQYETRPRSVSTKFRGELVIHAAQVAVPFWKMPDAFNVWWDNTDMSAKQMSYILNRGKGICYVTVTDIVPVESIRDSLSALELALGDYSDGRMAWKLENARPFPTPIPRKGQLGLWNWEAA